MAHVSEPAGEAFVESFANMARAMLAQSRALSRKVSLAQLVEHTGGTGSKSDDENEDPRRGMADERPAGSGFAQEKVLKDLRSLEKIVSTLELRVASAKDAIALERQSCVEIQEMQSEATKQSRDLRVLCASLPQHLPCAEPPDPLRPTAASPVEAAAPEMISTSNGASAAPPRGAQTAAAKVETGGRSSNTRHALPPPAETPSAPTLELVTVGELEKVPKSTRARLTLAQVNSAVTEIQQALEKRQAFLARPRTKLSEKQRRRHEELHKQVAPAHGGEPFLAEADIRALPSFKKGEVTAKALIATLRSLGRLRGVRVSGMMTYVVRES